MTLRHATLIFLISAAVTAHAADSSSDSGEEKGSAARREARSKRIAANRRLLDSLYITPAFGDLLRIEPHDGAQRILQSPDAEEILARIPEGSTYLGSGIEAVVLKTPDGQALRIGLTAERPAFSKLLRPHKVRRLRRYVMEWLRLADTSPSAACSSVETRT